jgi:rhodanese-related sulfurtransferase
MARDSTQVQVNQKVNWVLIYNLLGILAILLVSYFLYTVVRDTELPIDEPLELSIRQISPQEALRRLEAGEGVVIDVRTSIEWQHTDHVQNAISLPLQDFEAQAPALLPDKDALIIVMCYSENVRSARAVRWLVAQGYRNVYNLNGGLEAWMLADLPLLPPSRP